TDARRRNHPLSNSIDGEREVITKALRDNNGRRRDAAAQLNISERTLYRKIKEYNLE
ncbi:MAG TPA: helix-turn-helix domain-containing protein, partial [Muribaculaceae bacterium]|nr:helix-turn-helix domain-containing protein [Muribaculaceae bacterium]